MSKRLLGSKIKKDGRDGEITSAFITAVGGRKIKTVLAEFKDNKGYEEDITNEEYEIIEFGEEDQNSWLYEEESGDL